MIVKIKEAEGNRVCDLMPCDMCFKQTNKQKKVTMKKVRFLFAFIQTDVCVSVITHFLEILKSKILYVGSIKIKTSALMHA